jgi:hypothetical protein
MRRGRLGETKGPMRWGLTIYCGSLHERQEAGPGGGPASVCCLEISPFKGRHGALTYLSMRLRDRPPGPQRRTGRAKYGAADGPPFLLPLCRYRVPTRRRHSWAWSLGELGAQSRLRPQAAFAEAELVHVVIAPAVSVAPAGMPDATCAPCLPVGGLSCKSQDRRHCRSTAKVRDCALRAMRLLCSSFDVASEHDRAAHDQRDDSNDDCRDDPARNPGEIEEPADDSTAPRPGG